MSESHSCSETAQDCFQQGYKLFEQSLYPQAREAIDRAIELDPTFAKAWYLRGMLLHNEGNNEAAIATLDRAIELDCNDADIWVNRAYILQRLQRLPEALESYDRAIALEPDYQEWVWWFDRALVLAELNRNTAAIESAQRAAGIVLEENPTDQRSLSEIWCGLGDLWFDLGQYSEAIAMYEQVPDLPLDSESKRDQAYVALGQIDAITDDFSRHWALADQGRTAELLAEFAQFQQSDCDDEFVWEVWGRIFQQVEQDEAAIDCYKRTIAINPSSFNAWHGLELVLRKIGQETAIIDHYDEVLALHADNSEHNSELWFKRGTALFYLNRPEEALSSYDQSLSLNPQNSYVLSDRGRILREMGQAEAAIENCEEALKWDDGRHYGHICQIMADAAMDLERYEAALTYYNRALGIENPEFFYSIWEHWRAWYRRGLALAYLEQPEAAIESYAEAIEKLTDLRQAAKQNNESDFAYYSSQLANLWYNKAAEHQCLKQTDEAIESYTICLDIDPDHLDALHWCSVLLFDTARYEAALDRLNHLIELQPDNANAHYNKACVHAHLNQVDAALKSLQQAITLDPDCETTASTDPDWDSLRQDDRFQQIVGVVSA